MKIAKDKLGRLRALIEEQGVDGYLIPRADEFQGEFVAPYAERLKYLTGFTGSAGICAILQNKAIVMTDARYTLQVDQQVDLDVYETGDSTKTPIGEWLSEHSDEGVIGYDPWLFTAKQIADIEQHDVVLKAISKNLIDEIWEDQPEKPDSKTQKFPDNIAGKTSAEKCQEIVKIIEENDCHAALITMPDSIAWLLNQRGSDVDNIPIKLCYLLLDKNGQVFVIKNKNEAVDALKKLPGYHILLDERTCPVAFNHILEEMGESIVGLEIINIKDPCIRPKACKTKPEQDAIKQAHIADGVSVSMFLKWLEEQNAGELDEIKAQEKLYELRSQHKAFRGNSFPTISGFASNGAIVHYRASEETNKIFEEDNLLLIDSGGQYWGDEWAGTTDITRTIAIGEPSLEMKENFTRVLKGHIALARAKFPAGTTGAQLDTLARGPLWDVGLDYAHGTGHGVGCYLAVHEEAAHISSRGTEALQPGMLLSNEPGYYKEGHYGIRIENLIFVLEAGHCKDTGKDMLCFETVTLAPIDLSLVEPDMLTNDEQDWLNTYHQKVFDTLSSYLDETEKGWLERKTKLFTRHCEE